MPVVLPIKKWGYGLLILCALVYLAIEAQGDGDFYIFISASGQLSNHTNIYSQKFLEFYHYYYSVLFALLLRPFYSLPFFGVKFCWLLLNLLLYAHLFSMLLNSEFVKGLPQKRARWFLFGVFAFSLRFLHENLHSSQITILILWCSVYGMYQVYSGNQVRGALLIALGINIKLLPLVLLPYLLYRGFYKAFSTGLVACVVLLFVPGFVIGHAYNLELLKSWWHIINPANTHHVMDVDERSFHSLTTLLTTLFVEHPPDPLAMPLKRNIADVSVETLSKIIWGVRLAFIGCTLFFLRTWPFKKAGSQLQATAEVSYLLLLVPLIFPHQQHYAFLFAVPAFAVVFYFLVREYSKPALTAWRATAFCAGLSFLLCSLKLLLGEFNNYYEHYKLLTYGALLLVVLLALATNRHINTVKPTAGSGNNF